ncbi:MAG: S41 family peptidase [Epsilonproteobacteria bacterium]|nr:S41 family peptidase [Campylobacterota bacterium]
MSISSLQAQSKNDDSSERIDSMRKLASVLAIVEQNSVDDLNYTAIVNKTIAGLMNEIDAHSSYFSEKSYKDFKVTTEGEFGGLGINVGMRDKALTVIAPIDDTPAYKVGVKAGDIILKIDDKATMDMPLDEAVSLMRGKPKTPITLTIVRKGETKPLKFTIIRDIIKIDSVFVKTLDNDLLYIRVSNFDKKVVADVKKGINEKLKDRKGIILDLRSNPGGLLNQAVDLVDLFIDKGIIVSQKGKNESETKIYEATKGGYINIPLVVLIDVGSASASEIVSGALQDHRRAILVGEKSFGKGSVQAIWPITADGSEAIKLTVARYYLPSGRTIQASGVEPDIEVYMGNVPQKNEDGFEVREENLKKHLEGELKKVENNISSENDNILESLDDNKTVITKYRISKDSQLKSAIDILRSMIIMGVKK